tara:strand:+ start:23 stop:631 length:609 start_codon:yes stop_codon:yes gene_type:complete
MALVKTTKLQAINTILSVIGEAPINSLTGTLTSDVSLAQNTLDEVSREVQSIGWHFNTEKNISLAPDSDNKIIVNDNVIFVDIEGDYDTTDYDVVLRGNNLYNRKSQTYEFSSSITACTISLLDFDYLPETARRYITIRAARIFQDRMLGSGNQHDFTRADEQQALMNLRASEMDSGDYSIFDNYDVYRTLDRESIIRRVNS